jgi:CMP-N,N'-diacetyllegionaminic acid synthase
MYKNKKIVAIIPARGGSKRIKNKNLLELNGKPLIGYSIESAINSKFIDKIVVSTEDSRIKKISKKYGAEVVIRPKELSKDNSTTLSVLKNVLRFLEVKEDFFPDLVILLQPTSPIRKKGRIDEAINLFFKNSADMVISVSKRSLEPKWILEKTKKGTIDFSETNDFSRIREQDQKDFFELNGNIFVYKKEIIKKSRKYPFGKKVYPLLISKKESFQLDDLEDLEVIKNLIK